MRVRITIYRKLELPGVGDHGGENRVKWKRLENVLA
jgi:hypothetical protein